MLYKYYPCQSLQNSARWGEILCLYMYNIFKFNDKQKNSFAIALYRGLHYYIFIWSKVFMGSAKSWYWKLNFVLKIYEVFI